MQQPNPKKYKIIKDTATFSVSGVNELTLSFTSTTAGTPERVVIIIVSRFNKQNNRKQFCKL